MFDTTARFVVYVKIRHGGTRSIGTMGNHPSKLPWEPPVSLTRFDVLTLLQRELGRSNVESIQIRRVK